MTTVKQAMDEWTRFARPNLCPEVLAAQVEDTDEDTEDSGYLIGSQSWTNTGGISGQTGTAGGTGYSTYTTTASNGFPASHGLTTSSYVISQGTVKTKVRYIVVKQDGKTLEMKEKNQITPREMIGLSKFISLISVFAAGAGVYNTTISWSSLITEFSINEHFIEGLPPGNYPDDEVLNIFLYDTP